MTPYEQIDTDAQILDERVTTWREAESIAKERLDRRRAYMVRTMSDGAKHLRVRVIHTSECSGCFEAGEYMGLAHQYPWDERAQCHVGAGCGECGYTGKRRTEWWIELDLFRVMEEADKKER